MRFFMVASRCFLLMLLTPTLRAETFLPPHDIHISGTVVSPGCTVAAAKTTMVFGDSSAGPLTREALTQRVPLTLGACDFNGLGLSLRAETLAGEETHGLLRRERDNQTSTTVYYTVGPVALTDWRLAADSATPVKVVDGQAQFRLDGETYWYEAPLLSGQDLLPVPVAVTLHDASGRQADSMSVSDALLGRFTLTLSYR